MEDLADIEKPSWIRQSMFQILCCVAACSLAGLLGPWLWIADLFNHFRPQAIAAALLLLVPAVAMKERGSALLALAIILLNAGLIAERLAAFPAASRVAAPSSTAVVPVLFANLNIENTQHQRMLDLIAAEKPDIVVTVEGGAAWQTALAALKTDYPYSAVDTRDDAFAMAVYAKKPFSETRLVTGDFGLPLMALAFDGFTLIAAHPVPPLLLGYAAEQATYLQTLADLIAKTNGPVAVVGDLNATLWSRALANLDGLGLQRAGNLGFAATWPTNIPPLAVQIDHMFTRGLGVTDFRTLPAIGSDHRPIAATLLVPKLNAAP